MGLGVAFAVCPGFAPLLIERAQQFMKKEPKVKTKNPKIYYDIGEQFVKHSDKPGVIKMNDMARVMYSAGIVPDAKEVKKIEKKATKKEDISFEEFAEYIFQKYKGMYTINLAKSIAKTLN